MNIRDQFSKTPLFVACLILATVPLLFGAVHPIVSGAYVFLVLIGLGSWLCFFVPEDRPPLLSRSWLLPLLLLLTYAAAQSIPLPLSLIDMLSPARALRVDMANSLAGTEQYYISLSDHGIFSLTRVVLLLSLLVYFLSLKALMRTDDKVARILFLIVIAVGLLEALYGLFQFLSPRIGILWLPLKGRAAHGTIIYKNQFASFLNMCWPLALAGVSICLTGRAKSSTKKTRRQRLRERIRRMDDTERRAPLYFLATVIMLLAVLFTLSRGGIISMFLVLLLSNFFLPVSKKIKFIFLGFLALFVLGYGSLLGLDTLLSRFNNIGSSGSSRWGLYLASLPMLWDHYLTGVGLGSYAMLSPVYLKGLAFGALVDKAHNEYLQLAIEIGIPAALVLFSFLAYAMMTAGRTLLKRIKQSGEQVDPVLIIGSAAFCGLTGFFIHGFIDFGWRLPANLFYAVTLAALLSHSIADVRVKQNKG